MEVIREQHFNKRALAQGVGKAVPILVSFVFVWQGWGDLGPSFWFGIAIFVSAIIGFVRERGSTTIQTYRCARCRELLPAPTTKGLEEGDRIYIHCETCDVAWYTGMRH